ncbi:arylamine N-acetyltransferase 3 [Jackrogersella minutella]|nr:arylamine N-acetyltransferase 3 [Jackrogersella minutella]
MAGRPRYSHEQLKQFFDRIALPQSKRLYTVTEIQDDAKLQYLALLLKHTIVRIPFENLTQHYSWHRTINVHPQHLFNKIVRQPSRRGGYCMEVNSLFHTVLLSLGYKVFMAGARVYNKETGRYGGFSHCVNIAIVGNGRWMLDVGFGSNGPVTPIPLTHGVRREYIKTGPTAVRVVHEPIPQAVDQDQKVWVYQQCLKDDPKEWTSLYCFVDFEFLPEDIRGMNLSPWKSPTSWFTRKIMLSRFTTGLEEDGADGPGSASEREVSVGDIDGVLILFEDTLKWRRNGETKLEIKFESEAERVLAIQKYFDIQLDEQDREAIRGTVSEIRPNS